MNALGLSFDFHDASAALVADRSLVATSAEERFTLQKHDSSFPIHAANSTLRSARVRAADLDVVAFYEQPHEKFTRVLHSGFERFPRGSGLFARSMKKWLGNTLWTRNVIAEELGIGPKKVVYVPHHESHVAQAFVESPFDSAAVLVVDGVGEWACSSLATASRDGGVRLLEQYEYPQSIGLVYAAFTAFLGFKPNSGESSTMALAAFGTPRYAEEVGKVLRTLSDGSYEVDPDYFDFLAEDGRLFKPAFTALFGPPRAIQLKYPFDALKDEQAGVTEADQKYADIAASLQAVLTQVLLGLCDRLRRLSGEDNLCLAGGVAMNCLANTEIVRRSGFKHFFIPADPGDGGASVGAAAMVAGLGRPNPRATPYLGPDCQSADVSPFLLSSYLQELCAENRMEGVPSPEGMEIERYDDDRLIDVVSELLEEGCIVGWVQGRLESGPRALGNRSLLVDPANVEAVRRLSRTVKSHTHYRPYALSIAGEAAERVIDCAYTGEPVLRWMQTIWPVRSEVRQQLRAGVHVDGTTRPQLCWRDDNPRYWALLQAFGRRRGLPVLLNTSFNERSMPMVGSATVALMTFLRTGIDVLVLDNVVLRKRGHR
jgi:carbamoyltransferase